MVAKPQVARGFDPPRSHFTMQRHHAFVPARGAAASSGL